VKEKKSLGFHSDGEDQINETVEKNVMAEVKKAFNPEFLNRLDETSSSSRSPMAT